MKHAGTQMCSWCIRVPASAVGRSLVAQGSLCYHRNDIMRQTGGEGRMNGKTILLVGGMVVLVGSMVAVWMGQAGFSARNGVPAIPASLVGHPVPAGAWLFQRECSVCHGADGAGGPNAPDLATPAVQHLSPRTLESFIQTDMPADNPGILTTTEARDLAIFIQSLGMRQSG